MWLILTWYVKHFGPLKIFFQAQPLVKIIRCINAPYITKCIINTSLSATDRSSLASWSWVGVQWRQRRRSSGEGQWGGGACSSGMKGTGAEVLQLQWSMGVSCSCNGRWELPTNALTWSLATPSIQATMAPSREKEERQNRSLLSSLVPSSAFGRCSGASFAREKLLVHGWTSAGEVLWCAQCIIHHHYTTHYSLRHQ